MKEPWYLSLPEITEIHITKLSSNFKSVQVSYDTLTHCRQIKSKYIISIPYVPYGHTS
jgi:hypothetical protein